MKLGVCRLILLFPPLTLSLLAQPGASDAWMGEWIETQSGQRGEIAFLIGPKGQITGAISNTAVRLTGQWSGELLQNGTMRAKYVYPGQPPCDAVGNFVLNSRGELEGRATFSVTMGFQTRNLGIGTFRLRRRPELATRVALAAQICRVYPTRCNPPSGPTPVGPLGIPGYAGNSPKYTPGASTPLLRIWAAEGLPPEVRKLLDPLNWRDRIRSGEIDERIYRAMGNADQLMGIINGTGPGGAGYTNQAAIDLMNGNSLIWQLGSALSPYAKPLDDYARCRAAGTCR